MDGRDISLDCWREGGGFHAIGSALKTMVLGAAILLALPVCSEKMAFAEAMGQVSVDAAEPVTNTVSVAQPTVLASSTPKVDSSTPVAAENLTPMAIKPPVTVPLPVAETATSALSSKSESPAAVAPITKSEPVEASLKPAAPANDIEAAPIRASANPPAKTSVVTDAPATTSFGLSAGVIKRFASGGSADGCHGADLDWQGGWRRNLSPGAKAGNGKGVIEVLARYPLCKNQMLVLVRIGSQIVTLNQGKETSQSVLVISDPSEVAKIMGQIEGQSRSRFRPGLRNCWRMLGWISRIR